MPFQPRAGVDTGPIHLVEAGLIDQLRELGWDVAFDGHHQFESLSGIHDPPIGNLKNPRLVSRVCQSVADVVTRHCENGQLPVVLGGDHSLAMGTISGSLAKYPEAVVIWVDAHADINTIASTDSGNLHGMPVSFLLGINGPPASGSVNAQGYDEAMNQYSWIKPKLTADRLVYIGLRDIDAGEKQILRQHGIKAFSMHEGTSLFSRWSSSNWFVVDKYGIGRVVEMAIDHVNPKRDKPIHLSFDVDALDPSVAPSTGTPVRGGLSFREGHYICEAIHETGCLVALDLMEVNPSLLDAIAVSQTVAVGCSLVRCALGETLL
ncbi:Ureohydrolase [Auriculariales sp. MPI-PUGE-AT-0066]|nr:Ureohydrolase [Auriculariales sp. MPI-PUGE-AT-0066]